MNIHPVYVDYSWIPIKSFDYMCTIPAGINATAVNVTGAEATFKPSAESSGSCTCVCLSPLPPQLLPLCLALLKGRWQLPQGHLNQHLLQPQDRSLLHLGPGPGLLHQPHMTLHLLLAQGWLCLPQINRRSPGPAPKGCGTCPSPRAFGNLPQPQGIWHLLQPQGIGSCSCFTCPCTRCPSTSTRASSSSPKSRATSSCSCP